ncbi:GNAT family N-acetyltransferase [Massilia sp. 9096]|uniref:GNAT family N-acetyltransferase n=1 Tax=Massilia sp. 9096 TaxID=1500894 RepID=UPI00055D4F54|nr:GNAT family N-acetyltransferase [Massilia sp. 9096]
MGFEIRQATPDDAPAACSLLRRSIEHGCAADHAERPEILQTWLGNKTPQNVASWFGSPTNHAVVAQAQVHGVIELIGLALVNQAGRLALCYVDPAWLRHGVGSALLDAIETQARAWNISKLHMHSPASASPFFERLGYVNSGKDRACFGLECDFLWKPVDATAPPARRRFCNCSQ